MHMQIIAPLIEETVDSAVKVPPTLPKICRLAAII